MPLVSIVILNYNGGRLILNCIESILNSKYRNYEIIVVDNCSTDKSLEWIEEKFGPKIKIIKNNENLGFSRGNNIGANYSNGKYIVFMNYDTVVTPNWLMELVKVMENNPEIGVGQSKLFLMDNTARLDCAGGFIDYFGYPYERGYFESGLNKYNLIEKIFYAKGASMIVRRDLFYKVGCFDPDYFILYEETDFCWRVWLSGFEVALIPSSIVYHARGAAIKRIDKVKTFPFYNLRRNQITALLKNYDIFNLMKFVPCTVIFYISTVLYFVLKRRLDIAKSIIKSIISVFFDLKKIWLKRVYVQHNIRRVPDSILFNYSIIKKPNLRTLIMKLTTL